MQKSTRTFLKSRSAAEPFVPLDISRDLEGSRFHLLNISEPASFRLLPFYVREKEFLKLYGPLEWPLNCCFTEFFFVAVACSGQLFSNPHHDPSYPQPGTIPSDLQFMPTDFTNRFLLPGFANSQIEEVQASVGHIHLNCLRRVAQVLCTQKTDRSDLEHCEWCQLGGV